jgi:hypothetical protein
MGLPQKRTRRIVIDGFAYRWCVRDDGLHGDKGYGLVFHIQSAQGDGQHLVATLSCSAREGAGLRAQPLAPRFVRGIILIGLAASWRPKGRSLGPLALSGTVEYGGRIAHVNFISRQDEPEATWLNLTHEGDWTETDQDYADLERRVNVAIGSALAGELGERGRASGTGPVGIRLLCLREPSPAARRLLSRMRDFCASYGLAFSVCTLERGVARELGPLRTGGQKGHPG